MGGGFFDNMWDPYSAAYAYPRSQPRYYRPQAPMYEQRYPAYADRRGASRMQPEDHFPSEVKVEEPVSRKTVKTIPVTDGNVKAPQKVEVVRPVVRFESGDAAATKIQAVYRGYAVRKTEPLKHLQVIMKVKEEFEGFKRKFQEKEQRTKLRSDSKERLRWTEGIMALLLRLDQLQGVHPEVRLIRKAAAKELLMFQEKIDSMSDVSDEEEDVGDDDAVVEGANVEEDSVAEESSEVSEAAEVTDGDTNVPAAQAVEDSMEVEQTVSNVVDSEETQQAEVADSTIPVADEHQEMTMDPDEHQQTTMEQDSAPAEESNDSDGIKSTEMSTLEQHDAPHDNREEVANGEDTIVSPPDVVGEGMVSDAEQASGVELGFVQASAGAPMDVENEASTMVPARDSSEEVAAAADSLQTIPLMDVEGDQRESSEAPDDPSVPAPSTDSIAEPVSKEAELGESIEKDAGDDLRTCTSSEERVTDAEADGRMVSACCTSLMEPQWSSKSLQVGQPQVLSAADASSLSDRALLEQLLEENRKLRDVVGKVLHWGKQQNDIIHNLAGRIEQLEEHQSQSNLLHDAKGLNGRKRICNDGALVAGDRERSRCKGRRKGRQGQKPQLGYLDSEWPSPESDEYF